MKKTLFHFTVQLEVVKESKNPNAGRPSQIALTLHGNCSILLVVTPMPV